MAIPITVWIRGLFPY